MIPEILTDEENELTALAREALGELHDLFRNLDRRIASFDKKIERVFRASEDCQRIARVKGVGPKTATAATAVIAAIGDGPEFKNGRHLAAWVGPVPRQHSSGQRTVLLGISKCGSQHLRSLLVHGPGPSFERPLERRIPTTPGSTNFTGGVDSTGPRWPSPTRTHGSSGPCFGAAKPTAPLAEGPPRGCETMKK